MILMITQPLVLSLCPLAESRAFSFYRATSFRGTKFQEGRAGGQKLISKRKG